MKIKISLRYFAGFIAGGMIGVGYCKSSWPLLVQIVLAVVVCGAWHWWSLGCAD